MYSFTRTGMCQVFILALTAHAYGQGQWSDDEISNVFDGIDVSAAIARVEAKGVTPYDFGFSLLRKGYPDKAKEWFVAVGIHTEKLKYIYGLAWMKWVTGDSPGALRDVKYIFGRNPTPLIRARTLYLLGAIQVDENEFDHARTNLDAGNEAYKSLNKAGGQYLCTSMLAMCAVYEKKFDIVEPLLEEAARHNEAVRAKGKKAYSKGRHHEIISELRFAQGDYVAALMAAKKSVAVFRENNENHLGDDVEAKIGMLLFLNGEPQAAHAQASKLWEAHHHERDRGRLLAFNSITLMKLSMCAQIDDDAAEKEEAARAWARSGPGGQALIKLLDWIKDVPCPEWR